MRHEMNPDQARLDRPVPEGMQVDASGLVECWVAAAADWLSAWAGDADVSPREAFEGIEHLGRLRRCKSSLIHQAAGTEVLQRLTQALERESPGRLLALALEYPDVGGWLRQAQEAWDENSESLPVARRLLEDIDSLDFLTWYGELVHAKVSRTPDQTAWPAMQELLARCHAWLERQAVFFVIAEPYIRAVAKTIPEDLQIDEPTGCLALSAAKYIRLLDECEQAWVDFLGPPASALARRQPALGGLRLDYQLPERAYAAGAAVPHAGPSVACVWRDPAGRYRARLYLPSAVVPGEVTLLEMLFGTGVGFFDPAVELVGAEVRLGNATSVMHQRPQGDAVAVLAEFPLNAVTFGVGSTVRLSVQGEFWLQ